MPTCISITVKMSTETVMIKLLRSVVYAFLTVLYVIFLMCLGRTLFLPDRTSHKAPCISDDADFIATDTDMVDRFRGGLQIPTISRQRGDLNTKELIDIQQFIQKSYPTIHSSLFVDHEVIANYSLLYKIKGKNETLKPYLIMGHLDVVPTDDQLWDVPPFASEIRDGFIYARGSLDAKQIVFGALEACEYLLKNKYLLQRTFYFAFGHDEEVGGHDGAGAIADVLSQRNVEFEFILDEGTTVLDGIVPSMSKPAALISTTEKGRLGIKLSVKAKGGHSSMPLSESSIGVLSRAIVRLEDHPHLSQFGAGPERYMLEELAHEMPFPVRFLMRNLWLFSPLVGWYLSRKPEGNAISRTTTAITVFNAGTKDNVLATQATAIVNHRVHPAQTIQDVIDYDKYTINDDRVDMEIIYAVDPHPISPHGEHHFGYQILKSTILQIWGYSEVVVAPALSVGNTDTQHFLKLSSNIYRFSPTYMYPDDLQRFHGRNERLSLKNYEEAVNFYYHLILNADDIELQSLIKNKEEL